MIPSHTMPYPDAAPAAFLDRDGTLIEDRGHLRSPSDVVFYPDTFNALRRLQNEFRLFIVTNQSGIGKGLITSTEADQVNQYVVDQLHQAGVRIEQVYCCPHHRDEGCACIKPKPFFMEQAARDFTLDLSASFAVGDHPHDVQFATNAGAEGVYVLTGHGHQHRAEAPEGAKIVSGIREAADWILGRHFMRKLEREKPGQIANAAQILRNGGVVAFPTETVYGLGANALDAEAVAQIFEIKQRPHFDPLIVHIHTPEQLNELVCEIPASAQLVMDHFWPGPLTLVLPKNPDVPDLVTSGLPSVAVRMPAHPLALELLRQAGTPIAAPSANRFGCTSPTTAQHVFNQLGTAPGMILDGGPCAVGVESTIISFTEAQPVLLRAGGIAIEEIEHLLGPLRRNTLDDSQPTAPGQLSQHYSPRTPLLFKEQAPELSTLKIGLLSFREPGCRKSYCAVEVLSASGNLREAAANLFASMHRLDALHLDLILTERVPGTGLGLAINDRLSRAAHPQHPTSHR
ncbi:MAG: threonylcarbamoyl-AMP synthase [Kiritimatiellaceae bacterium]|nr:threonylcarbamoyl-AMP synthase [Kiritimatiellaceae bacterium]